MTSYSHKISFNGFVVETNGTEVTINGQRFVFSSQSEPAFTGRTRVKLVATVGRTRASEIGAIIPAIKLWREATGQGLGGAKSEIESLYAGTSLVLDLTREIPSHDILAQALVQGREVETIDWEGKRRNLGFRVVPA